MPAPLKKLSRPSNVLVVDIIFGSLYGGHERWCLGVDPKVGGLTLFDETLPVASGDTKGNVSN
jgi:hypothetical protein